MYIKKGLSEEYKSEVTRLLWEAFEDIFMPILKDKTKAIDLLNLSYNPEDCFLAIEDNKLLGVLAFQTKKSTFLSITMSNLVKIYGIVKGIFKAFTLSILDYECKSDEFYIDAIAVTEDSRGKKVGTKLLNYAFQFAVEQGFNSVSLQVVETNLKAKKLYERLGFRVVKNLKTWPFHKILNWDFHNTYLMKK